jgi:hypothetical protein
MHLHSGTRGGEAAVSGWSSRVRAVRFCGLVLVVAG